MGIKVTNDQVELIVIRPVYKNKRILQKDANGVVVGVLDEEIFVKEVRIPHTFSKAEIGPTSVYLTSRNKLSGRRSLIFSKITQQYYAVAHNYEELNKALEDGAEQIGFKVNR